MPNFENSNATFWVIFKQCAADLLLGSKRNKQILLSNISWSSFCNIHSSHPFSLLLFLKVIWVCANAENKCFQTKNSTERRGGAQVEKHFASVEMLLRFPLWRKQFCSCFYLNPSRISMTPLKFPMFQDACINRKTQESNALLPGWLPLEMINCTTHSVTWKEGLFRLKKQKTQWWENLKASEASYFHFYLTHFVILQKI